MGALGPGFRRDDSEEREGVLFCSRFCLRGLPDVTGDSSFLQVCLPCPFAGGWEGLYAGRTRRPGSRWYGGNPMLEESPGSRKTGRRLTAARRKPRESATESKPPCGFGQEVRVKGWGKSPPQRWQQGWHGKPRPEQDQVGGAHGPSSARAPGVSREAVSNDRPRGMAARPRKGRTEPGLLAFWSVFPRGDVTFTGTNSHKGSYTK